jgi:hypothetical protein
MEAAPSIKTGTIALILEHRNHPELAKTLRIFIEPVGANIPRENTGGLSPLTISNQQQRCTSAQRWKQLPHLPATALES